MTNLQITGNRAKSIGKPGRALLRVFRQFEGRKVYLKSGEFSFEPTPYNINLWMLTFPQATITEEGAVDPIFEDVVDRPKFELKREPLWWQAEAFEKFKKVGPGKENPYPVFAFLYDPGGGKSKSLTDAMCYLYCEGKIDAAIIVAPNDLVCEQWPMAQLPRDVPDNLPVSYWKWGKTKKADAAYEELKSFNGLQVVTMNVDATRTKRGKERLEDFIKKHNGRVLFAFDESHFGKNHSSQRHKAMAHLMGMCDWRALLTGTLIAKDLVDAWAQFKLLHEGILGHRYMTSFRSQYCETRHNGFGVEIIGHKNLDKFYKLIEPYSYRISQSELGLDKMYDSFEFTMSAEQKAVFKALKEEFLFQLDNGEFLTVATALAATIRMQQVTSGFLPREDGSLQWFENTRLKALDAWLDNMGNEKVVIWCRFKPDAIAIMEHFSKSASCVDLSGNVTKKERSENKDRFLTEPDILYAVGTPDAAGTGVDGLHEVCNRALFYSNSYNSLLRWQAEGRTCRVGGNDTAFYTDLICKASPDQRIIRNLRGKTDLSKMSLDDVRKIFS